MSTAIAPDAAFALGIAATAMPFARSPEDEAERWLRVLRLQGQSGIALQALGVSDGPLQGGGGEAAGGVGRGTGGASGAAGRVETAAGDPAGVAAGSTEPAPPDADPAGSERDVVAEVTAHAAAIADRRGAGGVGTRDLLAAVIELYGVHFDRVLRAHGTDSGEVLERIAV